MHAAVIGVAITMYSVVVACNRNRIDGMVIKSVTPSVQSNATESCDVIFSTLRSDAQDHPQHQMYPAGERYLFGVVNGTNAVLRG